MFTRKAVKVLVLWLTMSSLTPSTPGAPTRAPTMSSADAFRKLKHGNLLKYTKDMDDIIFRTVQEYRTSNLQGYNSSDDKDIYYKLIYNFTLTESERYIDQVKTLRAFLIPLENAMKELKKFKEKHPYRDVKLIRYQTLNIVLTITYVANHLGYSIPKYDRVTALKGSVTLFPKPTTRSLGNRVVSLLECLQDQLMFIRYYYDRKVHQSRITV